MTFWQSPEWEAYERAYGDEPGTRAKLLAEAKFKTRMVDLSLSEDELWRGVRKSYRPLIRRMDDEYPKDETGHSSRSRVVVFDAPCVVELARELHADIVGYETRPRETWEVMDRWLETGDSVLCMAASDADESSTRISWPWEGFAYFAIHGPWAYYFSAASLKPNLGLALIWWSMLALKQCGVRWCELGWQGAASNDKERNIEFVRRGFGGKDVPASWSGRGLTEEEWDGNQGQ